MGVAAVTAVFATENIVDILVSRYVQFELELFTWTIIAGVCAVIVYEIGDERGDW